MKKEELFKEAQKKFPLNEVKISLDKNPSPKVFFCKEDFFISNTEFSCKFGIENNKNKNIYRIKKRGFFRYKYLKKKNDVVLIDYTVLSFLEIKNIFPENKVETASPVDGGVVVYLSDKDLIFSQAMDLSIKFGIKPKNIERIKKEKKFFPRKGKNSFMIADWANEYGNIFLSRARSAVYRTTLGLRIPQADIEDIISEVTIRLYTNSENIDISEREISHAIYIKALYYAKTMFFMYQRNKKETVFSSYLFEDIDEDRVDFLSIEFNNQKNDLLDSDLAKIINVFINFGKEYTENFFGIKLAKETLDLLLIVAKKNELIEVSVTIDKIVNLFQKNMKNCQIHKASTGSVYLTIKNKKEIKIRISDHKTDRNDFDYNINPNHIGENIYQKFNFLKNKKL